MGTGVQVQFLLVSRPALPSPDNFPGERVHLPAIPTNVSLLAFPLTVYVHLTTKDKAKL